MDYMTYNVTKGHIVHKMGGGERMEREQTTKEYGERMGGT